VIGSAADRRRTLAAGHAAGLADRKATVTACCGSPAARIRTLRQVWRWGRRPAARRRRRRMGVGFRRRQSEASRHHVRRAARWSPPVPGHYCSPRAGSSCSLASSAESPAGPHSPARTVARKRVTAAAQGRDDSQQFKRHALAAAWPEGLEAELKMLQPRPVWPRNLAGALPSDFPETGLAHRQRSWTRFAPGTVAKCRRPMACREIMVRDHFLKALGADEVVNRARGFRWAGACACGVGQPKRTGCAAPLHQGLPNWFAGAGGMPQHVKASLWHRSLRELGTRFVQTRNLTYCP